VTKLKRACLFLAMLLAALGLGAVLGHRSSACRELQRYKAELRARGEKLTYAELAQGRATNCSGSYLSVSNAATRLAETTFSPGTIQHQKYVSPGLACAGWTEARPGLWHDSSAPAPALTWEGVNTQLETARDPLEQIRAALKDPDPDAGPYTNLNLLPYATRLNFVTMRKVAQWLACAALNETRQGHLEEALQNIEAVAALARMEREEPTLVAQMIRIAVTGLGVATTWELLQAPGWTDPQLARLHSAWQGVAPLEALERGMTGERAFGGEAWASVRQSSGGQMVPPAGPAPKPSLGEMMTVAYVVGQAYKLTSMDEDELFYLKTMQEGIATARQLQAHRPWREAKANWDNLMATLNRMSSGPQRFRHLLSLISLPNYVAAQRTAVHIECERQMTFAAIALKRFQLRHAKLPTELAALVPEFLAEVPCDGITGKPLCYRLKPDGSYLLYSVGDDGEDNGGDPNPPAGKGGPGLWEGRDAVWPNAATSPTSR
jgi:hypothetical protein